MSRADLLALTPAAIEALANVGLVKRAQRDLAAGTGPSLVEEADGTVVGTFADGVVTRLEPGKGLRETPCSCNSRTTCRHRVTVALAYPTWHPRSRETSGGVGAGCPSSPADGAWSPAEIDDASLGRVLGPRTLAKARELARAGLLATIEHHSPPTAKLPSCTVRFLVPQTLAYARCDCAEEACEHLALAVWAFRASGTDGVVALGGDAQRAELDLSVLDEARSIVADLLACGVASSPASKGRFARVRVRAERQRMLWIVSLLEDLEQRLEAYHARSALYSNAAVRTVVLEIEARVRAAKASATGSLPSRYVLGQGEAPETLLDHVRLISLGARVRADATTRFADVFLCDPDTATVLVLRKRWDDCGDDSTSLARRFVGARISLGQLATGQLVSKAVKRRANRSVEIGSTRATQSSVTPQHGGWDSMAAGVLVRDLRAHTETMRARPPWMLRPRLLAENAHVVAVGEVRSVVYLPAEQLVMAVLTDEAGNTLRATVAHRAVAPHAVDAASSAFSRPVRFVSGELSRDPLGYRMDVLAIAGDSLVVPDIAGPTTSPTLDRRAASAARDPIDESRSRAEGLLEEIVATGLDGANAALSERACAVANALRDVGLASSSARFQRLADATKARDRAAGIEAWFDAAVGIALLAEVG